MMSKERLEELLNDLPYTIRHSGELEPLKQFAREQSEQVQELEDIIYKDERQAVLEGMYEENKRYREALEYIADNKIEHGWNLKAVNCVVRARRALESEE